MVYQASEGAFPASIDSLIDEYLAENPSESGIVYGVGTAAPNEGRGIVTLSGDGLTKLDTSTTGPVGLYGLTW